MIGNGKLTLEQAQSLKDWAAMLADFCSDTEKILSTVGSSVFSREEQLKLQEKHEGAGEKRIQEIIDSCKTVDDKLDMAEVLLVSAGPFYYALASLSKQLTDEVKSMDGSVELITPDNHVLVFPDAFAQVTDIPKEIQ